MPTYSYECRKCGQVTDVYHAMSAAPRVKCGACGAGTKKLFGSGAGVIFKGSGFYETDYKRSTKADSKPAESGKSEAKTGGESKAVKSEGASSGKSEAGTAPAKAST